MVRVNGDLTSPSSGVSLLTTNYFTSRLRVSIDLWIGFEIGEYGNLHFSGRVNKYLTQEEQRCPDTSNRLSWTLWYDLRSDIRFELDSADNLDLERRRDVVGLAAYQQCGYRRMERASVFEGFEALTAMTIWTSYRLFAL